ncbi:DegT/DnrJ/EryC1/StrS family aminotransferase [Arthrobacter psychrochitiniphilus]|uniref:Aminotransferase DegT n=1 Tax=Arthrobacter psychrochitiniphilus TaxID=291045 RepID=A0A2V3DQ46_9MICC|nr:DegT/DnrJ/EryC1/StrS aminotransferase family protein [Arthrobacter psychrochitiniphilus]NYG18334.1 dTDP-4-amino-4,6-dideoxygalactose transaminase [Arthrobacter psychrochitiniphilus]PXA64887.1 aminotransferase DegT [Arthrobacter psychrochitiniphilus]
MSQDFIPAAKPIIGAEERAAVDAVMATGMLAQGKQVADFEIEFSDVLLDGRASVAVNSGTSGLHLGLLASGVGPGDEVIVPSFTFAATGNSVALTGATPVFADIELDYYSLDVAHVESLITDKTKGIMPVHLYGHPFAAEAFAALAQKHGIDLYEDAAQAHGAALNGKKVGTFGKFGMFSLYPTKNMTSGEGGMVSTSDATVERNLRLLRNQGMETQYENELVGFNNRMTDLHAAIGRVQLTKVMGWTKQRQDNAAFLTGNLEGVGTPKVAPGAEHVYHQYTIRVPEGRDELHARLRSEFNIGSGVYYPVPNHRLPSFNRVADLPNTEIAAKEVLSLPVHPSVTQNDLERIVTAVNTIVKAGA